MTKMTPNLEQITQKESFLHKIRSSITSKLAALIFSGTFALASCGIEEFAVPSDNHDSIDKPKITKIYQSGLPIKSGKTNQNGQIFFTDEQTKELVTINVKDEYEHPVPNAPVAFFDGNGFETYQVNHPDFTPHLHVFSHNSSHDLSLTSSAIQFNIYDSDSNENSINAAQKFTEYLKFTSQIKGCEIADEITTDARRRTIALGEIAGRVPGGEIGEYVAVLGSGLLSGITYLEDKFTEWGITENECIAYRTWTNEDVTEWNLGPSLGLKIYECMTSIPPENCYDGIDNDCDHKIDFEDDDCNTPSCSDECDSFGYKTCVGDSWKECGDFDSDDCLEWSSSNSCGSNKTCQDGLCISNCIPSNEICDGIDNNCNNYIDENNVCGPDCVDECVSAGQRDCFGDGWKECNNFDSDDCLEWSLLTLCGADNYCENGACLPNFGESSYCDPCESTHDCQEGMICSRFNSNSTWCTDDIECTDNSDCGGGYICNPFYNLCVPAKHLECHDENVWAKDNCGNWVYKYETCNFDEICQDGQCCQDNDNDGYGTDCSVSNDCDDNNPLVHQEINCISNGETCGDFWLCAEECPPTQEICDGIDNNCDGNVDEGNLCNGADCLEGICCYPHDHKTCEFTNWTSGIDLYWADACNRTEEMIEDCLSNMCKCHSATSDSECHCDNTPPTCYDPDRDNYGIYCDLGSDCNNSDPNINPGAPEILNGLDDNCNGQIDEDFVNTGDPQITLFWDNAADLDLHVYAPDDCHLHYGNPNCGAGHLDRDANSACHSDAETPPENIYWDSGQAPNGTYQVKVKYFDECSNSGSTDYIVSVSQNGHVTTYNGTLNNENEEDIVISFNK